MVTLLVSHGSGWLKAEASENTSAATRHGSAWTFESVNQVALSERDSVHAMSVTLLVFHASG